MALRSQRKTKKTMTNPANPYELELCSHTHVPALSHTNTDTQTLTSSQPTATAIPMQPQKCGVREVWTVMPLPWFQTPTHAHLHMWLIVHMSTHWVWKSTLFFIIIIIIKRAAGCVCSTSDTTPPHQRGLTNCRLRQINRLLPSKDTSWSSFVHVTFTFYALWSFFRSRFYTFFSPKANVVPE